VLGFGSTSIVDALNPNGSGAAIAAP